MLVILLALALGVALGLVAGLLPGLHPNTTVPIILGLSQILGALPTAIVLVSSGVVNCFANFIPSILLGAPDESTALGVLPGHRLLMEGRGYEAIKLCVKGGLGGILFSVATLPIFVIAIPSVYGFIRPHVHWLLIAMMGYLILEERGLKPAQALAYFVLTGLLGMVVLDGMGDMMLFPLLTGLFGLPLLLVSLFEKVNLPEKFTYDEDKMSRKGLAGCVGIGGIAGVMAGIMPGMGSTQSTIITQQIFGRNGGGREFLVSIGAITACDIVYSILALWLISNPRSGIAIGVSKLMEVGMKESFVFISVALISAAVAAVLTIKTAKIMLDILRKVNYQKLCLCVLAFLLVLCVLLTGPIGVAVLAVSTAVGLIPNYVDIRRTYGMGCLLLPTIFFFASSSLY